MPEDADPTAGGRLVWASSTRRKPAGNGSLMRTAPLGVFFADDPDERRRASLIDSAITHFDPRCRLACAVLNACIAEASRDTEAVLACAATELEASARWLRADEPSLATDIEAARADLASDLDAARAIDPALYSESLHLHDMEGFVRVAFRLAFWELVHAPGFEEALVDVVNRGGDADTNAAVAGALWGARCGASAIPQRWRDATLNALLDGPAGPWRDEYHPRRLLGMLRSDV
jgi:ADP-ribosylglycohydrolase